MTCHGSSAIVTNSNVPKALVKHPAQETGGDCSAQTLPGPLDTVTDHLFITYHSCLKGAVVQTDLVSCSGTQEQWLQSSQNRSPDEVLPWKRLWCLLHCSLNWASEAPVSKPGPLCFMPPSLHLCWLCSFTPCTVGQSLHIVPDSLFTPGQA